jgi:hypothetical protein
MIARMQLGVPSNGGGFSGVKYTIGSRASASGVNEFSVWEDMMGVVESQASLTTSLTTTPAVPPPRAKMRPLQHTKTNKSGTAQIKKRSSKLAKPNKTTLADHAPVEHEPAVTAEELDDVQLNEHVDNVPPPPRPPPVAPPPPSKPRKVGERQSTRQRLRPLEYWRGERVIYGPSEDGPSVVDVVLADDS